MSKERAPTPETENINSFFDFITGNKNRLRRKNTRREWQSRANQLNLNNASATLTSHPKWIEESESESSS